jgi:hypothetical protein
MRSVQRNIVDRLAALGLASRQPLLTDRRVKLVVLTRKGTAREGIYSTSSTRRRPNSIVWTAQISGR